MSTKIARHASRAALIGFTLLILVLAVAFSGCRSTRPAAVPAVTADATADVPPSLSTKPVKTDKAVDKPSLYRRLFPSKQQVSDNQRPDKSGLVSNHAQPVPRKCKGCTFNTVAGDQSNNTAGKNAAAGTGATTAAKADAPVATSGATATDNSKAGQRGGAAATAPNASATATTVKPGLPWARIGAGLAIGGFVVWVLFFGGGTTLLALWRRNKPDDNQA